MAKIKPQLQIFPVEVLNILHRLLGASRKSTQSKGRENYAFSCPFCQHHKQKLEIDILSGNWHCWVCNNKGRNLYPLLKRLNASRDDHITIARYYKQNLPRLEVQPSSEVVSIPKETIYLANRVSGSHFQKMAEQYLNRRGISKFDLVRYQIGYCEDGLERGKIIIPNYTATGQISYWTGRSFNPNSTHKFSGPSTNKNFVGFELLISWDFPVILCEGAMDAIAIRRNAIPLYGKVMNNALKTAIIDNRPPAIYIALDNDAKPDAMKIAEILISVGLTVYIVDLVDGDPNDIGYENFWKLIPKARKVDEIMIMQNKMGF